MLARLKALFAPGEEDGVHSERQLQLAAAALLIELGRADYRQSEGEQAAIAEAIRHSFTLDDETVAELLAEARSHADNATSLYQFTSLINRHFNEAERYRLICQLWRVAGADGDIHKYEDHLIRRVAELIYISHSQFIRAKLETLGS
jgi:uncharacterized tellurite resistance protein B-like protein